MVCLIKIGVKKIKQGKKLGSYSIMGYTVFDKETRMTL